MTGSSGSVDGGIRKKMRKGTHSCFECRRRKIRCVFSSDNQTVCNECFARGSKCIDQEHADSDVVLDQRKNLRERVAKLESLVENLLDDKSDRASAAEALKKLGAEIPTPTSQQESPVNSMTLPEHIHRGSTDRVQAIDAPVLSLFDNAVLSRVERKMSSLPGESPGPGQSKGGPNGGEAWQVPGFGEEISDIGMQRLKRDKIWQMLLKALPRDEELTQILRSNDAWFETLKHKCPGIIGGESSLEEFAVSCLTSKDPNPATLGTLLLCVSSCYPDNGEALDRALDLVYQYITSDDDFLGGVEGLECCMLQAKCYSDLGQARKSWRVIRRAISNAELMGLHRFHRQNAETDRIWWNLYLSDRMCSLMLGLPYAINDAHIDFTVGGVDLNNEATPETFMLKSAQIGGQVIDRLLGAKPATYSSAMELDQRMDKLVQELEPTKFWEVSAASTIDNPKDLVDWQMKVLGQIMFHQIRVYLHMPFMLQSATNKRYEYSRKACLDGAREMLRLYHLLRSETFIDYQCKVVDFIAFTANIIILLGLCGYGRISAPHDPTQDENDWRLIERSIDIFKIASTEKGGKVAEQSYTALKQFHLVRRWEGQGEGEDDEANCPGQNQIVIPYFGTISIKRGAKFHHIPTPGPTATPSSSTQQSTPASISASSFPQSNSSATSPSNASITHPYATQHGKNLKPPEQMGSTMDQFLSYDAGFWTAPHFTGSFDSNQFSDEPLSNYMSPTTSNPQSGSANSSAVNGMNWGVTPQSGLNGGFPWGGMSNMDIDQDWSAFMSDSQQGWPMPNTQSSQGQFGML